jgi:hypothetical protein
MGFKLTLALPIPIAKLTAIDHATGKVLNTLTMEKPFVDFAGIGTTVRKSGIRWH